MKHDFGGRKVLITGAGQGIGRALAVAMARLNARVYALNRTQANLDALVAEVPSITPICCDLSGSVDCIRESIKPHLPFDMLVNNAGANICEDFLEITESSYNSLMHLNLKVPTFLTQHVAKSMVENKIKGSIVNVSSVASMMTISQHTVYAHEMIPVRKKPSRYQRVKDRKFSTEGRRKVVHHKSNSSLRTQLSIDQMFEDASVDVSMTVDSVRDEPPVPFYQVERTRGELPATTLNDIFICQPLDIDEEIKFVETPPASHIECGSLRGTRFGDAKIAEFVKSQCSLSSRSSLRLKDDSSRRLMPPDVAESIREDEEAEAANDAKVSNSTSQPCPHDRKDSKPEFGEQSHQDNKGQNQKELVSKKIEIEPKALKPALKKKKPLPPSEKQQSIEDILKAVKLSPAPAVPKSEELPPSDPLSFDSIDLRHVEKGRAFSPVSRTQSDELVEVGRGRVHSLSKHIDNISKHLPADMYLPKRVDSMTATGGRATPSILSPSAEASKIYEGEERIPTPSVKALAKTFGQQMAHPVTPQAAKHEQKRAPKVSQEAKTATAQQEAKTAAVLQQEAKAATAQQEAKTAAVLQQETKAATAQQGAKTATAQQGAKTATGQQEAKTATGQQEAKTATGQQEAKTATGQQEAKTATAQQEAKPKTATMQQEAKTVTGQQEAKTATAQQGAKTATAQQEAKSTPTRPKPAQDTTIPPTTTDKSPHSVNPSLAPATKSDFSLHESSKPGLSKTLVPGPSVKSSKPKNTNAGKKGKK